ncbi:head-to-tail adaptor [Mycobacterium phage Knocker]|nr:head-to-tail adaptor [Mycobacterium phage Knocker]
MPFTWPIDRTGFPELPEPTAPEYARRLAEQRGAAQIAVSVMWALSGRQFGLTDATVRPCRTNLRNHHGPGPVTSYLLSWEGNGWINVPCGCSGACREAGPNVVHLPGPVHSVQRVEVNGNDLPANVWVLEGTRLYRRESPWPAQNLNRPLGDIGTWGVHYRRGIEVPVGVDELTGILAKEMLTAINDDVGRCRLPRTVTTVSRQGVTYRAYDPAVIYRQGKTGLAEIDLWLSSVNPHALLAAPSVI